MDAQLKNLLAKAASSSYQDRCDAATGLVTYDTPESDAALRDLLGDTSNTAPIQSAAEALLKRLDPRGAGLIFSAMSTGDEDAADHLLYFVACYAARVSDWAIYDFARSSLTSPDEDVRDGAAALLEDAEQSSGSGMPRGKSRSAGWHERVPDEVRSRDMELGWLPGPGCALVVARLRRERGSLGGGARGPGGRSARRGLQRV